jgi:O-antigen/teichoic acid export membrane protein
MARPDETSAAGQQAPSHEAFGDLSHADLRRRAFGGVFIVFSWNFAKLAVGFVGNLVLARLLSPRDFGLVAVGTTVTLIVGAFTEGGLGGGLIRGAKNPTPAELRTLAGVQLVLTSMAAFIIAAIGLQFGTAGQVTALMATAIPLASLSSPGFVRLVRGLHLRQLTVCEASGLFASYLWSISAVLAGFGVWGLASGVIARNVVATAAVWLTPEGGFFRPTLERVREFRQLLAFGVRFQANWIVIVLREQALNAITALVAGVTTLGLWSLGNRLMQMPAVLNESMGKVIFPTMAHLLGQGRPVRDPLERSARLSATAGGIMLSGFAASAPGLVPALFGEKWSGIVPVFPGTCLGLMIIGTVAPAGVGYLFAANQPQVVLNASIAYAVGVVGASAALLPLIGVSGNGIGWVVGAIGEAAVLARSVLRLTGANIVTPLLRPLVAASLGCAAGWAIASSVSNDLVGGVAGGSVASVLTLAVLGVVARDYVADLLSVVRRSARSAVTKSDTEDLDVAG